MARIVSIYKSVMCADREYDEHRETIVCGEWPERDEGRVISMKRTINKTCAYRGNIYLLHILSAQ